MTNIPSRLVCRSQLWLTPPEVLEPVRAYFNGQIPLDPATEDDNPTEAFYWFTAEQDGLDRAWKHPVFVNPPYGSALPAWVEKIRVEAHYGQVVLALLPTTRFSTRYFQPFLREVAAACWIKGRVAFLRPVEAAGALFPHYERCDQNPYDSVLYGFNVDPGRFESCFRELGAVWLLQRGEGS